MKNLLVTFHGRASCSRSVVVRVPDGFEFVGPSDANRLFELLDQEEIKNWRIDRPTEFEMTILSVGDTNKRHELEFDPNQP